MWSAEKLILFNVKDIRYENHCNGLMIQNEQGNVFQQKMYIVFEYIISRKIEMIKD